MAIEWITHKDNSLKTRIGKWTVLVLPSTRVPGKWRYRYVEDGTTAWQGGTEMYDDRDTARIEAEKFIYGLWTDEVASEKKTTKYKHHRGPLLDKLDSIEAKLAELRAMIGEKK